MAKRNLSIRLSVENQDTVVRALRQLGEEGEKALKQIERSTAPASRGLLALNAAGKEAKGALQDYAARLGPVGSVMEALGPAGMAAAAGIAGIGIAGAGILKLAGDVSKLGDELDEMSSATGVSVENLSTLKYAADISGSSLDGLKVGLKALSKNALEAFEGMQKGSAELSGDAKVWSELGIQITDTSGRLRPAYELFLASADALKGVTGDTERAALAQKVFGKSAMDLLPLLREGSGGIQEMQQRARELGGEFSAQAAKDAAQYQDAIAQLSVAMGGLGKGIAVELIPTLTTLAGGLADIIAKVHELGTVKPIVIPVGTPDVGRLFPDAPPSPAVPSGTLLGQLGTSGRARLDAIVQGRIGASAVAEASYAAGAMGQGQAGAAVAAALAPRPTSKAGPTPMSAEERRELERRQEAEARAAEEAKRLAERIAKDQLQIDQDLSLRRAQLYGQQADVEEALQLRRGNKVRALEARLQGDTVEMLARHQAERQRLSERGTAEQLAALQTVQSQELGQQTARTYRAWGRGVGPQQQALIDQYSAQLESLGPVSDEAGRQAALRLTQGLRSELQVNENADVKAPTERMAVTASAVFGASFESSLSGAIAAILEGEGITAALETLGTGIQTTMIQWTADKLAENASDAISEELKKVGISDFGDVLTKMGSLMSGGITGQLASDLKDYFKSGLKMANGPESMPSRFASMLGIDAAGPEIGKAMGAGVSAGLTTALMGKTLQSFGLNVSDKIIMEVALADGLATTLKASADPLGKKIGEGIQSGLTTFMMGQTLNSLTGNKIPTQLVLGVSLGSSFLSDLAPQSETAGKISTGISSAVKAGMLGAGIGRLFGDEITAQRGAIGAALGSIIGSSVGGTLGGTIGSGIGGGLFAVLDFLSGDAADRADARNATKEVVTDLSAYGGVRDYFDKVGGLAGFSGERAQQFKYTEVQDAFTQRLRTDLGLSRQEATDVMSVLTSQGQNIVLRGDWAASKARILAAVAKSGLGINPASLTWHQVRTEGGVIIPGQGPTGTLRQGLIDGIYYRDGEPFSGTTDDGTVYANGHPIGRPVIPVSPETQRLLSLGAPLAAQLSAGRVSKATLRGLGADLEAVIAALNGQGTPLTSDAAAAYLRAIGRSSYDVPSWEYALSQQYGIDVVAARGFAGTVNRPTTFLAGEAGPEDVVIVPQSMRRSVTGGGVSGGNVYLSLHMNVATPNVASMDAYVRRDLMPAINTILLEQSRRGKGIIVDRGIIRN